MSWSRKHISMDCHPHLQGVALVEAVISVLIVGVMLVAVLTTVGASRMSQYKTSVSSKGHMLAESLMAEILVQKYLDPDGSPTFGPETGESTATRAGFDDVDDYHEWSSSPPTAKDGTELPDLTGWQRNVSVHRVDPTDLTQVQGSDGGAKRITVTVTHNNVQAASLTAVRTDSGL